MYILDCNTNKKYELLEESLLTEFTEYLSDYLCLKITKSRTEKSLDVIRCWILNSYNKCIRGNYRIGITLKESNFSQAIIVNGRTTNKKISYTYTKHLLEFLYFNDYIEIYKGGLKPHGTWCYNENLKWTPEVEPSYISMNEKLINFYNKFKVDSSEDYLKNVIRLRNKAGKGVTFKMNPHKREVKEYLQEYNKISLKHSITLDDKVFDVQSYKVYNQTLTKGGRTYMSGSIQGLSGNSRAKLQIDGKDVVRLDYKGFEPNCCYELLGEYNDLRDPYDIKLDFIEESFQRGLIKKALLIMFNTRSYEDAYNALTYYYKKSYDSETLYKKGKSNLPFMPVKIILSAIEEAHYKISDKFYCSYGDELQYAGGLINDYVMNYFLQNTDILVLQVFDEFIIQEDMEQEMRKIMKQAFEMVFGSSQNCLIKRE